MSNSSSIIKFTYKDCDHFVVNIFYSSNNIIEMYAVNKPAKDFNSDYYNSYIRFDLNNSYIRFDLNKSLNLFTTSKLNINDQLLTELVDHEIVINNNLIYLSNSLLLKLL